MTAFWTNHSLWKWAVVIVVVVGTGTGLMRAFTPDLGPVEMFMQNSSGAGMRLKIPRAFLPWGEDRRGGNSDGMIGVIVSYPEMSPIERRRDSHDSDAELREIGIRPLEYEPLIQIRPAVPDFIGLIFADRIRREALVGGVNEHGFLVYRSKRSGMTYEYLVPVDQRTTTAQLDTVLDCGPYLDESLTRRLNGICVAYVQPSDRFYVVYEIPLRAVDQWKQVETKVLALVQSFVIDCFEGPKLAVGETPDDFQECGF